MRFHRAEHAASVDRDVRGTNRPPESPRASAEHIVDVVIIGSGFAGSVSALRLVEKGYRVAVLEAGRRFADTDFPKTSWDVRKFLWAPRLGCYGIQRISLLNDALILSGAGVGGGSLVYANTLYEPLPAFYADPQWAGITDWRTELAPWYDQAKRMLGVVQNPFITPADQLMRRVATDMGVADSFRPTPIGVHCDKPGADIADPYFGGVGPVRRGCIQCGGCMTGCRHNAKNTLVKNYLYLAEQAGVQVFPLTTVTAVIPQNSASSAAGYRIETVATNGLLRRPGPVFTAQHVIFAAGTLGTQRLLHRMQDAGHLDRLSPRFGQLTRTNSEAILGASTAKVTEDCSVGVAITSSFHPDASTHIEPVRYGKGSNFMGLLQIPLTDGGGRCPRWLKVVGRFVRQPNLIRTLWLRRWSERTVIALVMQTHDNSLTTYTKKRFFRRIMTTRPGHGAPNPTWIPVGNTAARRLAEHMGGEAGGSVTEMLNIPVTAHFLGGCPIGATAESGVIDAYHRVFGHPGLHVIDGSAISANLGVNPSLTITAQAERAMSFWPNKGELDPRPDGGSPYRPIPPVPPHSPVVPANAPGALWVGRARG